MAWNVSKAVFALDRNAAQTSQHLCAKYVSMAIEAGGISVAGRPAAASQYISYLPTIGFSNILSIKGREQQNRWSSTSAKAGDIAVMEHGKYGHICMWDGSQWVSDFFQNNMWVYSGNGTCYIYRYTGEKTQFTSTYQQYQLYGRTYATQTAAYQGIAIFNAPENNRMTGETATDATLFSGQESDRTRTRIYKASNPTLILDDMSMPMTPLGGDDNIDYTQTEA